MDPLTFDLILAGASMGLQALNTLAAKRSEMTFEQDAVIAKFQARITAAQQMVTPYLKETHQGFRAHRGNPGPQSGT
ncbi:MAG: hypothetical protein EHM27_18280 [Deltaproteobacteria bacterium]|nr:MAG: hypothetical protein EHM27_18280 [Deltaproteobacteria bacterium]